MHLNVKICNYDCEWIKLTYNDASLTGAEDKKPAVLAPFAHSPGEYVVSSTSSCVLGLVSNYRKVVLVSLL